VTYLVSLIFQLVTAGALLEQGTQAIGVLTAIHTGCVAAMFWTLLWYAITTTQVLDDGGLGSIIVSPCDSHSHQCQLDVLLRLDNACGTTRILRRHPLYQPRYCVRVHVNFRYPFPPARLTPQYSSVRLDQYMARSVRLLKFTFSFVIQH
jgi:hypothetical protein